MCKPFHVFAQFLFTASETKLHQYHWKVNVLVTSPVAEQRKAYDLNTLGNFGKIPEMLGFGDEY